LDWFQTWKATDVAIVFATLLGPVLAVQAQRLVDVLRERRRHRTAIFQTLMTTRAATLSPEHVRAINSIPLEFGGRRGALKEIISAWKQYMDHLNAREMKIEVWGPKRIDLFVALLDKMAKFLGYHFDAVELKNDVYSPLAHGQFETDQELIRRGLVSLLKGEAALPMEVRGWPVDAEALANQKEIQTRLLAWLRGEAAPPSVRIDGLGTGGEPEKHDKKRG
jgi:hypothetical protein